MAKRDEQIRLGGERVLILVRGLEDYAMRECLRGLPPRQLVLAAALREYWEDWHQRSLGEL